MALISRAVGRRKPQPGGPTATPIPAARSEKPSSEGVFEREMRVLRAQLVHFSSWLSQMTCRKLEVLWIMKEIVDVRAPRTC